MAIRTVLFDLDGVLYIGDEMIRGALKAVHMFVIWAYRWQV